MWNILGPNDALQTGSTIYYLKVEVGLDGSSRPSIRLSIGTGTNGSGTLTGYTLGTFLIPQTGIANQGATTFECNFSGDTGRAGVMLWRNGTGNCPSAFFVERTLATDGTPCTDGVNFAYVTYSAYVRSQTLMFIAGPGNLHSNVAGLGSMIAGATTDTFNNKVPATPVFPIAGVPLNPMTVCGFCPKDDLAEGALVSPITLYGATRTYLGSSNGHLGAFNYNPNATYLLSKLLMRWD